MYKYSKLNKVFTYKKNIVIYSGLTNSFVPFSVKEYFNFMLKLKCGVLSQSEITYYADLGVIYKESHKLLIQNLKREVVKSQVKQIPYITLSPTLNCNFKCSYCFVRPYLENSEISYELIDNVIDYIRTHGNQYSIEWFGGEPTLSIGILEYFYKKAQNYSLRNVESILITNGSYYNYSRIESIIIKYITIIQVTIDGTEKVHNTRRCFRDGSGTYERIISFLDFIFDLLKRNIEKKLQVTVRFNADKSNVDSFEDVFWFIRERYHDCFHIELSKVEDCGYSNYKKVIIKEKDFANLIIRLYKKGVILNPYFSSEVIRFKSCGAVSPKTYSIVPDGKVYKCSLDIGIPERCIGHIGLTTNTHNSTESNYLLANTEFLPKKCMSCSLLLFCWGGCIHKRLEKKMKSVCTYQKYKLDKFLRIIYESQVMENNNDKL